MTHICNYCEKESVFFFIHHNGMTSSICSDHWEYHTKWHIDAEYQVTRDEFEISYIMKELISMTHECTYCRSSAEFFYVTRMAPKNQKFYAACLDHQEYHESFCEHATRSVDQDEFEALRVITE
jgi:hypothetical protein